MVSFLVLLFLASYKRVTTNSQVLAKFARFYFVKTDNQNYVAIVKSTMIIDCIILKYAFCNDMQSAGFVTLVYKKCANIE